ncbi:MAG: hypothetical protein V3U16_02420 [Candidatus Neomarinimicrobiota bacterium]
MDKLYNLRSRKQSDRTITRYSVDSLELWDDAETTINFLKQQHYYLVYAKLHSDKYRESILNTENSDDVLLINHKSLIELDNLIKKYPSHRLIAEAKLMQGFIIDYCWSVEFSNQRLHSISDVTILRKEALEIIDASNKSIGQFDYIFKRKDDAWMVKYGGIEAFIKHTEGMNILHFLIKYNNKDIPIMNLSFAMADNSISANNYLDDMPADKMEDKESLSVNYYGSMELADKMTVNQCRDRLKELQIARADANSKGDMIRINEINNEVASLKLYLTSVLGKRGNSRKINTESQKENRRMQSLLKTANNNIGEHIPQLSKHLKSFVKIGMIYRYTPDRDVDWVV